MGCIPAKPTQYCRRYPAEAEGESQVLVNAAQEDIEYNDETLATTLLETVKNHGQRKFYGTREYLPDGTRGKYQWKTYKEVFENAKALGSYIHEKELAPLISGETPLRSVGVYSKNREEYATLIEACVLFSTTVIPLYDTLGPDVVQYILEDTKMTTVFCSGESLDALLSLGTEGKANDLKTVVVFDSLKPEMLEKVNKSGLNVVTYEEAVHQGKENPQEFVLPKPDDIYYISYTSGTTGTPKAAMLSHKNIYTNITSTLQMFKITHNDVYLSYLPLAHMAEGTTFQMFLRQGVSIGVYSGDPKAVVGDLAELRPTIFGGVPRVYNRFYTMIQNKLREAPEKKRKVAYSAIESKMKTYRKTGDFKHFLYDKIMFKKMAAVLGGRVRLMLTGAAPMHPDVLAFLKVCFCCEFHEIYGGTEIGGVGSTTTGNDPVLGHIGAPFPGIKAKLVSVPELGYSVNDTDAEGFPLIRGELCFKGRNIFSGYYNDPERTKLAFDSNGWLLTGDIAQLDENGRLKIIDRKKAIFKLSQGEYVAPEKIEGVYALCKFVGQCWVYGDSLRDYVVAVVVPDEDTLKSEAKSKLNLEGTPAELVTKPEVKKMILDDLTETGKECGLKGFERVKNIHLQAEMFTPENVLTPTLKVKRNVAKEHFAKILDDLYAQEV